MSETEYKRVFQLAKDRAQFGFAGLAQRMLKDADESIMQALSEARSMLDQKALKAARQVVQAEGSLLLRRMDALFGAQLERALRTMYTDLRPDTAKLSADDLSLIDDETVSRQIEVDRLMQRMRDANEEIIGRLNVIVAQLHGDRGARERENPFRPYLLARTLYEALKESPTEENVAKLLFEHLSNALIKHLPAYYAGVVTAFESGGIQAEYTPQPSRMVRGQRYFGAVLKGLEAPPENLSARALSGMQGMFELLARVPETLSPPDQAPAGPAGQEPRLQDLLLKVLGASQWQGAGAGNAWPALAAQSAAPAGSAGMPTPEVKPLISQLNQFQSSVAGGTGDMDAPAPNQSFVLRDKLEPEQASPLERVVIDVVAMLFDFLLGDEKIAPTLRNQLGRLQVPFLKAALLDAKVLQDARHPARRLLNRMSGVAAGCDAGTPFGAAVLNLSTRAVQRVLDGYDNDTRVFGDVLEEFEQGLLVQLRRAEDGTARAAEALDRAEQAGILLAATGSALSDLLAPLKVEPRVGSFITSTWARVLVQSFMNQSASDARGPGYRQFHDLLPELVWSIQDKQSPQERSALMRLLPDLVKRLRAGLALIGLPEEEARQPMDLLVELHMQVLRPGPAKRLEKPPTLEELRGRFSLLALDGAAAPWMHGTRLQVPRELLAAALAERDVQAALHLESEMNYMEEGEQFLAELQPGCCLKRLSVGTADGLMRLHWVTPQRSLYLFKTEGDGALAVYAPASLLATLMEGSLRPVEYAPIFERAVESMLAGAEALQTDANRGN